MVGHSLTGRDRVANRSRRDECHLEGHGDVHGAAGDHNVGAGAALQSSHGRPPGEAEGKLIDEEPVSTETNLVSGDGDRDGAAASEGMVAELEIRRSAEQVGAVRMVVPRYVDVGMPEKIKI